MSTPDTNPGRHPDQLANAHASARQLADFLVEGHVVSPSSVHAALERQRSKGGTVIDALLGLGALTPSALVEFLLKHPGAVGAGLASLRIAPETVQVLDGALARKYRVVPIDKAGHMLLLGAPQPIPSDALHEIGMATNSEVRVLLCSSDDIESALKLYYGVPECALEEGAGVNALELHGALKLSHVAQLIQGVQSLPALPETVTRVHEAMEDPAVSVNEVVEIITMDPPIAAKVLSVANSASYGFPHQIKDLPLAVSLLGLRETYSVVLSVAVVDFLHKLKGFDYRVFWLESMCCAAASRIVARASGRRTLPGVFTAGLLHDLGRAVLWDAVPELCRQIDTELAGRALVAAEERIIGISHNEAGHELAVHWSLPTEICEVIRFHHRPQDATDHREYVAIAALADAMVQAPGAVLEDNPDVFNGLEGALETLQLDMEIAEAMLADYLVLRDAALREAEG